jgi:hypothetical protein
MSSTKRGGGRRGRGRGRGRGAVAENDMDHLESAPSSPSTTSDREDNAIPIPRQSPACYVGPSELSSTLLNPKINHRSDAIFGDQVCLMSLSLIIAHKKLHASEYYIITEI